MKKCYVVSWKYMCTHVLCNGVMYWVFYVRTQTNTTFPPLQCICWNTFKYCLEHDIRKYTVISPYVDASNFRMFYKRSMLITSGISLNKPDDCCFEHLSLSHIRHNTVYTVHCFLYQWNHYWYFDRLFWPFVCQAARHHHTLRST